MEPNWQDDPGANQFVVAWGSLYANKNIIQQETYLLDGVVSLLEAGY